MRGGVVAAAGSVAAHAVILGAALWLLSEPPRAPSRVDIEVMGAEVRPKVAPPPRTDRPRERDRLLPHRSTVRVARTEPSPAPAPEPSPALAPEPSPEPLPAPAPAPAPSPAPDPESIRLAIEHAIRYPRVAQSQGLEGRVLLRFRIDPTGNPTDLTILASAGAILDDAARDAVLRAAPYHQPPGWVRVPVDFSLRPKP